MSNPFGFLKVQLGFPRQLQVLFLQTAAQSSCSFMRTGLFLSRMEKPKTALRKSCTSSAIKKTPSRFDPVLAGPVSLELNFRLTWGSRCLESRCQKHLIVFGKRTRFSTNGDEKRKKFLTISKKSNQKWLLFKNS